jgi:hypothetical protein
VDGVAKDLLGPSEGRHRALANLKAQKMLSANDAAKQKRFAVELEGIVAELKVI